MIIASFTLRDLHAHMQEPLEPAHAEALDAPRVTPLGLDDGPLVPGEPWLFALLLRAPVKGAGVVVPTDVAMWATAMQVVLFDAQGKVVPIEAQLLAAPPPASGLLAPGAWHVVRVRVHAGVTATLSPGEYRWSVSYRAPARGSSRSHAKAWSGVTTAHTLAVNVGADPAAATPAREARRRAVQVADFLFEADLLRLEASRADVALAQRHELVRRMALPLARAEAAVRAQLARDPSDAAAAYDLALVLAAAGDASGAERAAADGFALEKAGAPPDSRPSPLELASLRALAATRPFSPAELDETLRGSFAAARRGEDPLATTPALARDSASPASPPAKDPGNPPADPPAVRGEVSTGEARALDERFAADADGQWAASAVASTQYSDPTYAAARATGAPDVPAHGDHANAWTPSAADREAEWLRCAYASPVRATEVRVRQNFNPGAVTRVTLLGANGRALTVFSGVDPNVYAVGQVGWFVVKFPATDFDVTGVQLDFDTARVPGWNEVDAVQLVRAPGTGR
ncbi:MAG: hypothetical protein JNM84_12100 [Planctomycetes bacterium]|nr:hypothetical protein [Planctomycetota bacterium]